MMGLQNLTGRPLRLMLLSTAGCAFLLFGYDQGVMGGLVSLESFKNRFNNPNPALLGFMVASYDIGCLLGTALTFVYGDKLGRRRAITYACMVLVIGALLQTFSYSQAQYIVGRIVAGLGTGCISVTVPIYVSECANAASRGVLLVIETTLVIMGIVISNFTNFGFVYGRPELNGTEAQWRIPLGLQMAFPPFVFLLMPFIPESPRWLAAVGRTEEVPEVLARLRGKGTTKDTPEIQEQANIIIQTVIHEDQIASPWRDMFAGGELQNFRRLILGASTGLLHQATGINVVIYYAPVIFREIGLDDRMSYIMSCVGSICLLIGSILPIFWIERMGRRRTMLLGAWTTGICMGMIAATGAISQNYSSRAAASGWAGAAFVLLFQFCFGIGWNSMPWLYASEIGSLKMRNRTSSSMCLAHWATNFLSVMVAPTGFTSLGWQEKSQTHCKKFKLTEIRRFYLVWMSVTLAALPFVYFCFPETALRSLEQMDDYFRQYQSWNISKVAHVWVRESALGVPTTTAEEKQETETSLQQLEEAS